MLEEGISWIYFIKLLFSVNQYNISMDSMETIGVGSSRTAYALEDWLCLKKAIG